MGVSLTAHNFPEGFAVAISSLQSHSMASVVTFAIAMHNIPEGIAIAVSVLASTGSRWHALWMTFLSGMAEPLGAIVSLMLVHTTGALSQKGINNLLCIVGGCMLVVATAELLPDAWSQGRPAVCIFGTLLGCVIMLLTISLGN